MTPEGKVKVAVDRAIEKLKEKGHAIYKHKPVMNGMGAPTLDYVGCAWGFYFAIETKAPGKKLTPVQQQTAGSICMAFGTVFTITDSFGIDMFVDWVEAQALRYTRLVHLDMS